MASLKEVKNRIASVNSTRKAVPDLWKDQVTELMK